MKKLFSKAQAKCLEQSESAYEVHSTEKNNPNALQPYNETGLKKNIKLITQSSNEKDHKMFARNCLSKTIMDNYKFQTKSAMFIHQLLKIEIDSKN